MNEPVAPGKKVESGDWLTGKLGDSYFVQYVALDPGDRTPSDIFRQWIHGLTTAIRKQDDRHLITLGMLPFVPNKVSDDLEFLCVHLYPQGKKVDEALKTLHGFAAFGKPVVIEETFPLSCSQEEFEDFIDKSGKDAAGWIGFYWGKPPDELKPPKTIAEAITLNWLEFFQKKAKTIRANPEK